MGGGKGEKPRAYLIVTLRKRRRTLPKGSLRAFIPDAQARSPNTAQNLGVSDSLPNIRGENTAELTSDTENECFREDRVLGTFSRTLLSLHKQDALFHTPVNQAEKGKWYLRTLVLAFLSFS